SALGRRESAITLPFTFHVEQSRSTIAGEYFLSSSANRHFKRIRIGNANAIVPQHGRKCTSQSRPERARWMCPRPRQPVLYGAARVPGVAGDQATWLVSGREQRTHRDRVDRKFNATMAKPFKWTCGCKPLSVARNRDF